MTVPLVLDQRDASAYRSARDAAADARRADIAAQVDISTLGKELAIWYVDNDGLPPSVTVSDGQYIVNGRAAADVSPGVVLGGVTGTGATDWCVWVTNAEGSLKTFQYSAVGGMENGTC